MYPTLFGLRTYSIVYVLSMIVLAGGAIIACRMRRVPLRIGVILGLLYVFGMVPGAKLLYDLMHGGADWRSYLDVGYYLGGGLWGGGLAYLAVAVPLVVLGRPHWRERADIIAWTLPPALLVAKSACFLNGCCYGVESSLPWAVAFPAGAKAPAGVFRHPTQLYEVAVNLAIVVVFWFLRRETGKGTLLLWFVLLYGVGRSLADSSRGDGARVPNIGMLTGSQAVCLAAAAISAVGLLWRFATNRRKVAC